MIRGDEARARRTMRLVYTDISDEIIELKLAALRETVALSNVFQERWPLRKRPWIILKTAGYRRPLVVACGTMAFQQLCGFNSLLCESGSGRGDQRETSAEVRPALICTSHATQIIPQPSSSPQASITPLQ